jgi:hypothetical protein
LHRRVPKRYADDESFGRDAIQEAAMSTITLIPEAAGLAGKTRFEQEAGFSGFRSDVPEYTDESRMHAWSIGVTSSAREMVPAEAEHREECPPEVYIG